MKKGWKNIIKYYHKERNSERSRYILRIIGIYVFVGKFSMGISLNLYIYINHSSVLSLMLTKR